VSLKAAPAAGTVQGARMRLTSGWIWSAALGLAAGLGVLGAIEGFVVPRSQAILDARHPAAPSAVHAASTPEAVARGAHLVQVTDCAACHGGRLTGGVMSLSSSTIYAPNLTVVGKTLSDAELDRAIRRGLRPDGRSELAMPSQAYVGFTDDEVAAIIAYLRSLPPKGTNLAQPPLGLILRANLARGALKTEVQRVAEARPPVAAGPGVERGRRLAAVACSQCHGADLGGGPGSPGPDLTVNTYYDRAQFHALMRDTGRPTENMELMSQTALTSFSHFDDGEVDAIFDYLMARDRVLGVKGKG
jgi:mono/diheme cytochrome c family protein